MNGSAFPVTRSSPKKWASIPTRRQSASSQRHDKTIPEQTPWILFVSRIRNAPIYSLGQYLARNEAIFRREAANHSLGDFFAPEGGFSAVLGGSSRLPQFSINGVSGMYVWQVLGGSSPLPQSSEKKLVTESASECTFCGEVGAVLTASIQYCSVDEQFPANERRLRTGLNGGKRNAWRTRLPMAGKGAGHEYWQRPFRYQQRPFRE